MVAAVYYVATESDQHVLLDFLGEPDTVSLRPWPVVATRPVPLTRAEALAADAVMIVSTDLGPPVVLRPGDPAMTESSRAGVFNRLNWERLRPSRREGLVDSNASPVLFWRPAAATGAVLPASELGSQADTQRAISADYERWVRRATGWVRRKGTVIWTEGRSARPDLDVRFRFYNTVYALPGALAQLERGGSAR